MKVILRKSLWVQLTCVSLWSAFAFGQSSDVRDSLALCNNGWQACEQSRTVPPLLPVAAKTGAEQEPARASELSDSLVVCTDGWETCEFSKVAQADISGSDHQQNVSNCRKASASATA